MRSGAVTSLLSVLPTSQVFTSGYVNMETFLYFFYKIANERGTKTVFTYTHVKWPIRACVLFELFYKLEYLYNLHYIKWYNEPS